MLALIASNVNTRNLPFQADEPIDRDPGIITLTTALLRALRRQRDAAFRRRCDLAGKTSVNR